MVNMPHLGGLACAAMMISAVTTNHFLQKEQIKEQQEELTQKQQECRDAQTERIQVQRELNQAQTERTQAQRERNEAQIERDEAQQQVRHLLTRNADLRRQIQPQDAQIRQELMQLHSDSNRFTSERYCYQQEQAMWDNFTFDAVRITTAPDYTKLAEPQTNDIEQSLLPNEECMFTGRPVDKLYQPVALKTGNIYNVFEYVDLKLWFRQNLKNPYTQQALSAEILNTTDENKRVLFRVNKDFIARARATATQIPT
jgi:multidrug efflux pump subunit AcrA (membrane-fusion protein)